MAPTSKPIFSCWIFQFFCWRSKFLWWYSDLFSDDVPLRAGRGGGWSGGLPVRASHGASPSSEAGRTLQGADGGLFEGRKNRKSANAQFYKNKQSTRGVFQGRVSRLSGLSWDCLLKLTKIVHTTLFTKFRTNVCSSAANRKLLKEVIKLRDHGH